MRTNRSEHVANVTLAQAARTASRPAWLDAPSARAAMASAYLEPMAARVAKREARRARLARIATACAPGGSVGPWLRFAGYAGVVALAAFYGSAHA